MAQFWNKLFEWDKPETAGELIHFRLVEVLVSYQILTLIWAWAAYIPKLKEVILPLGMAHYIDISIFFGNSLAYINAAIITVLLLTGIMRKWKFSYLLALVFFHFQYAARYSQGEISHGSNLAGIILLSLGLAFVFSKTEIEAKKSAFGFMFFFIGLAYVSAACSKVIGSGLNWWNGDHLRLWIAERGTDTLSKNGFFEPNILQKSILDHRFIGSLSLLFGLAVELCGFLLWFRKTRWIEATLLIMMHFGILITMNIFFHNYIFILVVIGYPWHKLIDKLLISTNKELAGTALSTTT